MTLIDYIKDIVSWVFHHFWLVFIILLIIFSAFWYRTKIVEDPFTWEIFLEEIS